MTEPLLSPSATRDCPTCGELLQAAVESCPVCGAAFEVTTQAYCTHCHQLVQAAAEGLCPGCGGGGLLDPRLSSRLVSPGTLPVSSPPQAAPSVASSSPPPQPSASPAPGSATKVCPLCAETIKADARICRFCRARFEVTVRGYCLACHAQVHLDENDCCSRCGGPVLDPQVTSALIASSAPSLAPQPVSSPAPVPGVTPAPVWASAASLSTAAPVNPPWSFGSFYFSPRGRIGRLSFFLKGMLPLAGVMTLLSFIFFFIINPSDPASSSDSMGILAAVSLILFSLVFLVLFYVYLVLIVKRFHDLGQSGWNILLWIVPIAGPFISLVNWVQFFFIPGTDGPNKFGDSAV